MTRRVSVLSFWLVVTTSSVALAQAGAPLPGMMPRGVLLPAEMGECCDGFTVGHWVEYLVVSPLRREVWNLHLAVVGREGSAYWIEMTVAQPRGGEALSRMLVEPAPEAEGRRLLRLVIQAEGQMPLELPLDQAGSTLPEIDAGQGEGVLVGTERLRVTAGTYHTRHFRRGSGENVRDLWLSDRIPLWGLARFEGPNVRLTLIAVGTGAMSRLAGEPVPFDPSSLR